MKKIIIAFMTVLLLASLNGQEVLSRIKIQIPIKPKIDDGFKKVFAELVQAYEGRDISGFIKHVHRDFQSLDSFNKRLNYNLLLRSVKDDFAILSNMKFQFFVTTVHQQKDAKKARMNLRWNFRAILVNNNQILIERERETIVFFEKQDNEWKLRSIQGICLFGRTNPNGKLLVEAPFTLDRLQQNNDLVIDLFNGPEINNGDQQTVTLVSVEDPINNVFAFQQVNLLNGEISDFTLGEPVDSQNHLGLTSVLDDSVFIQGLDANGNNTELELRLTDIGRVINNIGTANLPFGVRIDNITIEVQGTQFTGTLTITFPF